MDMGYTILFFTVCGAWIASEIVITRMKRSEASSSRQDRSSFTVLWLAMAVGPFVAGILTSVRSMLMPPAFRPYAFWGGLALILIGIAIRWTAIATLKRYFTVDVAIAKDHKVIDHGIYGIIRHPSYTGTLLSTLGLGFAFVNWLSLAACIVFPIAAFAYRIAVEERALTDALGDEYRTYAARTKRLIPGVF